MHFLLTFNSSHGHGLTSPSIFWVTLSYIKAKGEMASSEMIRKTHNITDRKGQLGYLVCPLAETELFFKADTPAQF
jgi:hypothetical protein